METERRRKLTPAERAAEDKELEKQGLKVFKKDKRKLKFMQKYVLCACVGGGCGGIATRAASVCACHVACVNSRPSVAVA